MYTKSSIGIYDSLYVYMYIVYLMKERELKTVNVYRYTRDISTSGKKPARPAVYVHVNFRAENQGNCNARNAFVSNKFLHRDGRGGRS